MGENLAPLNLAPRMVESHFSPEPNVPPRPLSPEPPDEVADEVAARPENEAFTEETDDEAENSLSENSFDDDALPNDEAWLATQTNDQLLWHAEGGRFDYHDFELLFARWKQTHDPRVRERLIMLHKNMVTFLARRFVDRGELLEDVMQVGMMGLINALDSFDPARGVKFSTFAMPTISGEIRRYFRDKVAGMKVPRRMQELYLFLGPHIEEMTQRIGRSPTYAEIAASLEIEVEEVVEALELGSALDPGSLDEPAFSDPDGGTVGETLGARDPELAEMEENAALQAALERLEPNKRRVLELAYFEGLPQIEIARRLNVSQMHVSRLLRKSLAELRGLLDEV